MITSGGTTTLGLYDNASEIRKKADITYVDSRVGDFQAQVVSVAGGHKAYTTLALAQAAQSSLPANTIVEVTNDGANNGTYQWNGTTLTKSDYDPVNQLKDYIANVGHAKLSTNAATNINYTTSDRTLTFSNIIYVITNNENITLSVPQSVVLTNNTPYRLEFELSTGLISAVPQNTARTIGKLSLGVLSATDELLITNDFKFAINGVEYVNRNYGELITSIHSRINFDNTTKKLILDVGVRLKSPTISTLLSILSAENRSIDYSSLDGTYILEFNLTTKTFAFNLIANNQALNSIQVARVDITSGTVTKVYDIENYTISNRRVYPAHSGSLLTSDATRIAVNNTSKTITLATGVRVKSPLFTTVLTSDQTLSFTGITSGVYRIEYDLATRTFNLNLASNDQLDNTIALATAYIASSVISALSNVDNYTVDGVKNGTVAASTFDGRLSATDPAAINFDFKTNQLIIANNAVRLNYADKTVLLAEQSVDITPTPITYWYRLLFNTSTNAFSIIRTNVVLPANTIEVALIKHDTKQVIGVPSYYIDGRAVGSSAFDFATTRYLHAFGDLSANYKQPELLSYASLVTSNYSDVYALYDALLAAYPAYITKSHLGDDALGNPLYQYIFKTPDVLYTTTAARKPKVIILSNLHGWEKAGTFNTYLALKEICERWQSDEHLEALKWGVTFVVVPVCNPSGFNAGTRGNHNGVDLNRNFSTNWVPTDVGITYGGAAAQDQLETQIMDSVMNANKDAIALISHHNFDDVGQNPDMTYGAFIWVSAKSQLSANMAKSLIMKSTIEAKKRYSFMRQEDDYYIGYTTITFPNGGEAAHSQIKYGIPSVTFEICERFTFAPSESTQSQKFSSAVATIGVESFINWLLLTVRNNTEMLTMKL